MRLRGKHVRPIEAVYGTCTYIDALVGLLWQPLSRLREGFEYSEIAVWPGIKDINFAKCNGCAQRP